MTRPDADGPDEASRAPISAEEDAQVRDLLGSLPPAGELPADVARRLDAQLATLVAERPPVTGAADVLSARRRRARTALLVAASVAAVGLGLGTVLDDLSLGGGASDSASGPSAEDEVAAGSAPESAGGAAKGGADGETDGGTDGEPEFYLATVPQRLSRATLEADVRRLEARSARVAAGREGEEGDPDSTDTGGPTLLGDDADTAAEILDPCAVPAVRPGDNVAPVTLDGSRATLVLRAAQAGTREAEIYACDSSDDVIARTVVPAG